MTKKCRSLCLSNALEIEAFFCDTFKSFMNANAFTYVNNSQVHSNYNAILKIIRQQVICIMFVYVLVINYYLPIMLVRFYVSQTCIGTYS